MLYEIIGTRQKVLFVEGTKNSYDHYLYQEIYKDKGYHVIPCGGCQEVIRLVKAKRTYEKLNAINVYGIVDRDFRTEDEISALRGDGIYCLDVAEVENCQNCLILWRPHWRVILEQHNKQKILLAICSPKIKIIKLHSLWRKK